MVRPRTPLTALEGSRVLEALDAEAVRRWYEWGLAALDDTRDEINSLNVFPVPDADTGTNLHLTLESAVQPDDETPALDTADLASTATQMARLSLLGARGSSGVILSQLLRGVAEVLAAERLPPRGLGLTRALERAVALAYAAVSHPVEGTMLTVARAAAEAARATGSDHLPTVAEAAAHAAHQALARTPEQLDVLARAGVVDAGGRGVVVLLDVLRAVVDEQPLPVLPPQIAHPHLDALDLERRPEQRYEVMYLLDTDPEAGARADAEIAQLRSRLDTIGDSVVVSGGGGLWTVHVHTNDASGAVEMGSAAGHPHRIRVTALPELTEHHDAIDHEHQAGHRLFVVLADDSPVLALREVFAAAGATLITVTAASTLAATAESAPADAVLLFETVSPDAMTNVEKSLAAQGFRLASVSTRSPVQLLAAIAVHDPARPVADDVVAMTAASAATRHGDVRPSGTDFVGAIEGCDEFSAATPDEAGVGVVERLLTPDVELVTIVAKSPVAAKVAERLREHHAGLDVVTIAADIGRCVWLGVE